MNIKLNVYNGVKIMSILLFFDETDIKMDVFFIKKFDADTIKERFNITKKTKNPEVLKKLFNKYLEENNHTRTLKEYIIDVQKNGFLSPYYPGLEMEVIELIDDITWKNRKVCYE